MAEIVNNLLLVKNVFFHDRKCSSFKWSVNQTQFYKHKVKRINIVTIVIGPNIGQILTKQERFYGYRLLHKAYHNSSFK